MNWKYLNIITLLFALVANAQQNYSHNVVRQGNEEYDQELADEKIVEVRQLQPQGNITGILPPSELVANLSRKFFNAIKKLPKEFIKNSDIRYVTFLDDLRLKGISAAGLASKETNTIYLSTKFREITIYHELFHIIDPVRKNKNWCRLNANNFVYTGSQYYSENLSKSQYKRAKKNLTRRTFNLDFVSRYAMSNEVEDRAETFAHMIVEGPNFLKRTRKSKVLKRKMDYIIQITSEKKLVSKSYWKRRFRK